MLSAVCHQFCFSKQREKSSIDILLILLEKDSYITHVPKQCFSLSLTELRVEHIIYYVQILAMCMCGIVYQYLIRLARIRRKYMYTIFKLTVNLVSIFDLLLNERRVLSCYRVRTCCKIAALYFFFSVK